MSHHAYQQRKATVYWWNGNALMNIMFIHITSIGAHFSKKKNHGSRSIHGSHLEKVKCEMRISLHGLWVIRVHCCPTAAASHCRPFCRFTGLWFEKWEMGIVKVHFSKPKIWLANRESSREMWIHFLEKCAPGNLIALTPFLHLPRAGSIHPLFKRAMSYPP